MQHQPLAGVKVIELANFIAAATAGRFFADQGADVIKIESAKGEPLRYTAPSEGRPLDYNENTTWALENANKRNLSLNTKTPEGQAILFKLLEQADVFITNWRVAALERAGLDYESLKKRFPKLVYGLITGYGEKGPDRDLPGFDFTAYFARGGYLEMLRPRDGRPMNIVPGVGDHNVGMNLAAGLLAALYHARETGRGEKVETSLYETAIFNMGMMIQAAQYPEVGRPYPILIREADNPLLAAWETKDHRYIQTCTPDYNTYYNPFMKAIGREDLVDDPRYFPVQQMQAQQQGTAVYDLVAAAFAERDLETWREILTKADIPFGVAATWTEILQDEQAWANGCFTELTFPSGATRACVNQPVRFTERGAAPYEHGPMVGQHSEEILAELGYDEAEIEALKSNQAIYSWNPEDFKRFMRS